MLRALDYDRSVFGLRHVIIAAAAVTVMSVGSAIGDPTGRYVELSGEVLAGPRKLASLLSEHVVVGEPLPAPEAAASIARQTRASLDRLRALPLRDRALRTQRSRLVTAVADVIPVMDAVSRALATHNRRAIARAGNRFLQRVRALPSRVAPASP